MHIRLDCELSQGKHHTGKNVDDDLANSSITVLFLGTLYRDETHLLTETSSISTKNDIPSQQPCHKAIIATLFFDPGHAEIP